MLQHNRMLADRLAVYWDRKPIQNPTLMTVRLCNSGRRDIAAGAFDGARPISLVADGEIVALLDPDPFTGAGGLLPTRLANDSEYIVELGPGLIKKKQDMVVVFLGEAITRCEMEAPLEDVSVKEVGSAQDLRSEWLERLERMISLIALLGLLALVSFVVYAGFAR